jgi:hypothetical protein
LEYFGGDGKKMTAVHTFSDIQQTARGLYSGRPIRLLMTPIRNDEILGVLQEAETAGWVQLTVVGGVPENGRGVQLNAPIPAIKEAVVQLASGKGEVFLSDPLDPKPLFKELLKKNLGLRKEIEVWSHVAVFEWQTPPRWLLVSDGVLGTRHNLVRRIGVIQNTVKVANCLGVSAPNVALLAASRAIQQDVQTSREWTWVSKMGQRGIFHQANVYGPVGLEEAIQSGNHQMADALIAADISVANPLVSALNLLCGLPCAGMVVGGDVPVVLPWPSIDRTSVLTSLAMAALCSPRGLRRLIVEGAVEPRPRKGKR